MEESKVDFELLFSRPSRYLFRVSADGQFISYIEPHNGRLELFVAAVTDHENPFCVSAEMPDPACWKYTWMPNRRDIVMLRQAESGGLLYAFDIETRRLRNLEAAVPIDQLRETSACLPDDILVAGTNLDTGTRQFLRINVVTRKAEVVLENSDYVGAVFDHQLRPRVCIKAHNEGITEHVYLREDGQVYNTDVVKEPDTMFTRPLCIDYDGKILYRIDTRGHDKTALYATELQTGQSSILYPSDDADIDNLILHPVNRRVQAVCTNPGRRLWKAVDPGFERRLQHVLSSRDADLVELSRSLDDKTWLAGFCRDDSPVEYCLFGDGRREPLLQLSNKPALEGRVLLPTRTLQLPFSGDQSMSAYLTMPKANDDGANDDGANKDEPPLVVLLHSEPGARSKWELNPYHQYLGLCGFGVLSVNYRGTAGFGKDFFNAGFGKWSTSLPEDLDACFDQLGKDAGAFKRIVLLGIGFGGYLALAVLSSARKSRYSAGVVVSAHWKRSYLGEKTRALSDGEWRTFVAQRFDSIGVPILLCWGSEDSAEVKEHAQALHQSLHRRGISVTAQEHKGDRDGFTSTASHEAFLRDAIGFIRSVTVPPTDAASPTQTS